MNEDKLNKANEINKEIHELENILETINPYKGRDSAFEFISTRYYRVEIEDKDTKDLVEEFIVFRLTKKLEKLKKEFENL